MCQKKKIKNFYLQIKSLKIKINFIVIKLKIK